MVSNNKYTYVLAALIISIIAISGCTPIEQTTTDVVTIGVIVPPEEFEAIHKMFNPARDAILGSNTRAIYDPTKTILVVTGLGHTEGVRLELEDLDPEVLTLTDY
jgi:pheromone shutdown protein TraB